MSELHAAKMPPVTDRWIAPLRPSAGARLRLFCLPYAGGGAGIFRLWPDQLPPDIEVCPVHLPGRGARFRERPFTRVRSLVEALSRALLPHLDKPFALFGHSMGGLVGFELARQLRRDHQPAPLHLFVSGRPAPHLPPRASAIHLLPHDDFLQKVGSLEGTPREVLESRELTELIVPILRADFEACESYSYVPEPPLACGITAFGGSQDPQMVPEDLEAWRVQTSGAFGMWLLPGNHFFLDGARHALLRIVARELARHA